MKENKKEEAPKEKAPDYEQLYYKAMQEVQVLKGGDIDIKFSKEDVDLVKELLYAELYELSEKLSLVDWEDEEEKAEAEMLKKIDKDEVLHKMMRERKIRIEGLINKLNFEK